MLIRVLKGVGGIALALALVTAFAIFVLDVPLPWKQAHAESSPPPPPEITPIELVEGQPQTVMVPESVRATLGIRRGDKDIGQTEARQPTQSRPLEMPGSTALDPARIIRIRARFAPAEVVEIGQTQDLIRSAGDYREIRPGDEVKAGTKLGVFYSIDVGNKKNDLFEAVVQYRLDKGILDNAEKAEASLPQVFLWNARRNVQTDRSAIIRAKNTLKTWNIADEDINAVIKEAEQLSLTENRKSSYQDAEWGEKQERWARVVLKAPCDGVIVERNVARGETIVDNTINLFTIAQVDRLAVLVNLPEDELPKLQELNYQQRKWTIQTVGARSTKGLLGTIDEIGYLIDPNQHTAIIKGYIDNPKNERNEHVMRAGQFVSATVNLPPPKDVVEIPASAIVEDGRQSVVFVVTDAAKGHYTMRRVVVTHRHDKAVLVSSTALPEAEQLTPEEKEEGLLPRQPLQLGESVLTSGVLELKAALLDRQAKLASEELNHKGHKEHEERRK